MLSLRGAHLLDGRLFMALVSDPLEALALELGELDAVGGVTDVEVEHGFGAPRPRAIRSRPRASQSSWDSRIPTITPKSTRSPSSVWRFLGRKPLRNPP